MRGLGQPGIVTKFGHPNGDVIASDYTRIVWWTRAMTGTAAILAEMEQSPQSVALRDKLALHLKNVAAETAEHFNHPWGLLVMFLITGARARYELTYTGPCLTLTYDGPAAAHQALTGG
jgi:hypothetical protein